MSSFSHIAVCCFSPTGGTMKVARHLAEALGRRLHLDVVSHPYTLPAQREAPLDLDDDALLIWATPVYAGRIPNKTRDYVATSLQGRHNVAIAMVAYGNRHYDNALAELLGLMKDGGYRPIAAAAVVTRHVMSETLAAGRPDASDMAALEAFVEEIADKLGNDDLSVVTAPGDEHPERYYAPLRTDKKPASFLKVRPQCDVARCTQCGACYDVCPMGSVKVEAGHPVFDGICIKCQACRLACPQQAIAFTDDDMLSHIAMVEQTNRERKEGEYFV